MNKLIVDIGGNAVKYKLREKSISFFSSIGKNKEYVLNKISSIVNKENIEYLAISSPCGVDTSSGFLHGISGIKEYENFNIYKELKAKIDHPCFIIAHNDANAALLGNLIGENISSAAQITIGTGIGGSIYINNEIVTGFKAMAGDFGYIPYNGKKTISEECSANALVKLVNQNLKSNFNNYEEILYSKKNIDKIKQKWFKNVAGLISLIAFSVAPEKIFISGGITKDITIQKGIVETFNKLMIQMNYNFNFVIEFKNISNPAIKGMASILQDKQNN